jgi:hypothetical protein
VLLASFSSISSPADEVSHGARSARLCLVQREVPSLPAGGAASGGGWVSVETTNTNQPVDSRVDLEMNAMGHVPPHR